MTALRVDVEWAFGDWGPWGLQLSAFLYHLVIRPIA